MLPSLEKNSDLLAQKVLFMPLGTLCILLCYAHIFTDTLAIAILSANYSITIIIIYRHIMETSMPVNFKIVSIQILMLFNKHILLVSIYIISVGEYEYITTT